MSDVTDLLERIIEISNQSFDVRDIEQLLEELVQLLASAPTRRGEFIQDLLDMIANKTGTYPNYRLGTPEILEYCMRELQWEEIRLFLEELSKAPSIRDQDFANRILEVYEEEWPAGDIYSKYYSD